jgi:hypothetical protein
LRERVGVRGKRKQNFENLRPFHPHPYPSPVEGEGKNRVSGCKQGKSSWEGFYALE